MGSRFVLIIPLPNSHTVADERGLTVLKTAPTGVPLQRSKKQEKDDLLAGGAASIETSLQTESIPFAPVALSFNS